MVIFSGVPDPQWRVNQSVFNASDYEGILGIGRNPDCIPARLGYKGFLVQNADMGELLIVGTGAEPVRLQQLLLQLMPVQLIPSELRQRVSNEIGNVSASSECVTNRRKRLAPPFFPFLWNNVPNTRRNNNCYNYVNIRITNTYAQPGRGGGQIFTGLNGAALISAAVRDDLQTLSFQPGPGDPVPGVSIGPRHLVALFVDPG